MTDPSPSPPDSPCPLCGGRSRAAYEHLVWPLREGGRDFRYRECAACDLMFSSPTPDADELNWLYSKRYGYEWFRKRRALKRIQAHHRWSRLTAITRQYGLSGRKFLDVGGGHAWLLRAAKTAGWAAHGLELLSDDLLRTAGVEMHHGTLVENDLAGHQFDLLTMWHALEHMPDPRAALAGAAHLLAPGGLCVIAVPNRHALGYQRDREHWVWCQKPFIHPWHFSAEALRRILPDELEPLFITSRDTWDAQAAEATPAYRGVKRAIYYACRAPQKLALLAGLKRAADWMDEAQFLGEEALRLATYAGYTILRPLWRKSYEEALLGSELLLVARRKTRG